MCMYVLIFNYLIFVTIIILYRILVDMFPFKFEFKQILDIYLDMKFGKDTELRRANKYRMSAHLFTIYLIYLSSNNREKNISMAKSIKKYHYNVEATKEQIEYLSSLPDNLTTKEFFTEDEYKLIDLSGIQLDRITDIQEVHGFLVDMIYKYLDLKYYIEVLKDFKNYAYWYAIVSSRSYKMNLKDYERLIGSNVVDQIKGKEHFDLIEDYSYGKNANFTLLYSL